jgi:hypothetical protein
MDAQQYGRDVIRCIIDTQPNKRLQLNRTGNLGGQLT